MCVRERTVCLCVCAYVVAAMGKAYTNERAWATFVLFLLRLLLRPTRDGGEVGGGYLCPNTYEFHCHHQNDSALRRAAVWDILMFHYVWVKSQDSVHKPQFLKRKENRSGSNRGPATYQPSLTARPHRLTLIFTPISGPLCWQYPEDVRTKGPFGTVVSALCSLPSRSCVLYSVLQSRHKAWCRIVNAASVCTTWTKIVAHVKDSMFTIWYEMA